jgi:hypothetical protein
MFLALAVAGNVSSWVHLAFTEHALCEEHGEWVELRSAAHESAASQPAGDVAHAGDVVGHEHEHCVFALHQRQHSVVSVAAPLHSAVVLGANLGRAPPRVVVASSIPLLHLAPKSSPPIA